MSTEEVAAWASSLNAASLPPAVRAEARRCFADTAGVLLAGLATDTARAVRAFADRRGVRADADAPLALSGAPDTIALLLGAAGHALDFDDGAPGAVHASAPVLAALLALGAEPGSADLLTAFVAGWEVTVRTARALGLQHYRRGWHTTGTAGSIGATAAAARLLGLDVSATRTALGIAASSAAGLQRNFGTDTKPLHCGLAARNGIVAAELAALGLSAAPDALDGAGGLLDVFGDSGARPEALTFAGTDFAIVDPGVIRKAYPCCYAAARAVDAARQLRAELPVEPSASGGLDVDRIAAIDCAGPIGSFAALTAPEARTGLEGKFSLPYAVASALLDDVPTLAAFTDAAVRRPAARTLMARTTVAELERCRPEDPTGVASSPVAGGFVEVVVRTTAGTTHRAAVWVAHGAPDDPLSDAEIAAKYGACAAAAGIEPNAAADLLTRLTRDPLQPIEPPR